MQLVDRPAGGLAGDVPEGHLDARQHRQPETDPTPPQRALVELPEARLGLARVEPELHQQAAVVVDQRRHGVGAEVAHDRLADAAEPLVRLDHDERGRAFEQLARLPERVARPGRRDEDRADRRHPHRGSSAGRVDDDVARHGGRVRPGRTARRRRPAPGGTCRARARRHRRRRPQDPTSPAGRRGRRAHRARGRRGCRRRSGRRRRGRPPRCRRPRPPREARPASRSNARADGRRGSRR